MKLQIRNISLTTIYTFVYAAFFAVQLFFNLDITDSSKAAVYTANYPGKFSSAKSPLAFTKETGHPSSKKNFRLNKRFQGKTVTPCSITSTALFVNYIREDEAAGYPENFILSPHLSAHSLRGPPVVV